VKNFEMVDYSRKWYVMTAVAMGVFLATIDGSIVNVALPTLTEALQADFAWVQWVVLAYLLTVTSLMLGFGRLADMVGKKLIYQTGFVIFVLGSALCGTAPNVGWLIGFRVLQAVGAAMMMALGTAIVTEAFPSSERGRALGVMGLMVSLGIITGPTLGGLILNSLSWRWIFYVNLPIGLAGIVLVQRNVQMLRPMGGQHFDVLGAVFLFFGLLGLLLALSLGQNLGFANGVVLALLVGFVLFLMLFIGVELRQEQPMVDLRLFQDGLFSVNLLTGFLSFVASAGTILLMPFYLQDVLGLPPARLGLVMGVVPLLVGMIAPFSGRLSDRVGSRILTTIGLAILLMGYVAVGTLGADTTVWGYVVRFAPVGIGLGFFQSPNNSAIMGAVPRNRLGVASGLLSVTRTLGQTTGVALLGSIWASQMRGYAGAGGANVTALPVTSQVMALHDALRLAAGLVLVSLLLSLWALQRWFADKKTQQQ
jgi:EmrB/QacA subfamily drug resistance transporter